MSLTYQSLPIFRVVKVDPHNRRPKAENRHQKASPWSAALRAAQQPMVMKLDQTRAEHGPKCVSSI